MRFSLRLAVVCGVVTAALVGSSPAQKTAGVGASGGTSVTIESGPLQGAESGGIVAFKGIPYAAAPVGDLRWRDPRPAPHWTVPRDATNFGPDCMQALGNADAMAKGTYSEDCLFVNVWRSAGATHALPVMVWIHGGGFVSGSGSARVFDGTEYAKRGVVLVTLNYRLGRLGFFAHPALTAEAPKDVTANYGLMDQLAALQWVQRNIAAFGGDPKTVTIFGESAGGGSVQALMTSPLVKGLFVRAISESGAGRPIEAASMTTLAHAEQVGVAFAKSVGIEGTGKDALAKLRTVPAATLRGDLTMMRARAETDTYSGVIADGKFVLDAPANIYAKGGGAPVALMIGATSMDARIADETTAEALYATFGAQAAKAKATYDPTGTLDVRTVRQLVGSDRQMVEPARYAAQMYAKRGLPAYEYRFSYVPVAVRATVKGAAHASELSFVFNTGGGAARKGVTEQDKAMAETIIGYWAAFGRTGDPNGEGRPVWPKYDAATDLLMDFTNDGAKVGPDPWKARLDVTEAAAAEAAAASEKP